MVVWFKSLFRHFQVRLLGTLLLANFFCLIPFVAALGLPLVLGDLGWGNIALSLGFLAAGQLLALTGRLLDVRFRGKTPAQGGLLKAWGAAWAEGLALGVLFLILFSLAFRSVPYYWEQGTAFSWFSLAVLAVGVVLILGSLPFYLPVRRREGLGLFASATRAVRLMNTRPLGALSCALFSLLSIAASIGTLGLFPGWAGLAALHQGVYDHITGSRGSSAPADPENEPR
jgi:hypothetical protein